MTISDKKQKNKVEVYIDTERCKGCGLCITFCPQGALSYDQKMNTQGYNPALFSTEKDCNGCKRCQIMCPDLAITVVRKKDKD
jgi:2-oxoglutarate ferredoxin oxidoreductase subunit delta